MSQPRMKDYRFGYIVINGQEHEKDVIVLPDRVIGGWWRKEGHRLHAGDLEAVFEAAPDTLIVGQGAYGRMQVPEETRHAIEQAGIRLIVKPTGEAVQNYEALRQEEKVAAALHLTC